MNWFLIKMCMSPEIWLVKTFVFNSKNNISRWQLGVAGLSLSIDCISGLSLDIESSGESEPDIGEEDADSKSTSSWEDMSKLDPNMLLYKAAQARNLPVMLEALSNGADPNWTNEEEDDKTPIMKVVETVSFLSLVFIQKFLQAFVITFCPAPGRHSVHPLTVTMGRYRLRNY